MRVGLAWAAIVAATLAVGGEVPATAAAVAVSPEGRWATLDDRTGEVRAIVRVRVESGQLHGFVEKVVRGPAGEPDPVCSHCKGVRHNQRVVGMEIMGGYHLAGDRWKGGRIVDPENGKEYSSAVWLEGPDRLRVRGYRGPFHRTQTWRRVSAP
jgi:uncharacterized protein (DUF2147 family)